MSGYPGVVPRPVVSTDVAAAPGPMAGVIEGEGIAEWSLVDAAGRSWQVPDVNELDSFPLALSDDGRWLGRLGADHGPGPTEGFYVITDLVTGATHEFPQVGDSRTLVSGGEVSQSYWVAPQAPGSWSPDSRWLYLPGGTSDGRGRSSLLLSVDGEVRVLGLEGWPAGWLGPDRLVLLTAGGELVTVDLTGSVVARVQLEGASEAETLHQWSGRLSPEGSRIAVGSGSGGGGELATYDTATGQLVDSSAADDRWSDTCQLMWQGDRVLAWTYDDGLVDTGSGESVIRLAGDWPPTTCGQFVPDALAGPAQPGPGPTEWRYWSWLVWWKQVLAGLVVAALAVGLYARRRRLG